MHIRILGVLFVTFALTGCKDMTGKLPAGTVLPAYYQNEEAALKMVRGIRYTFQNLFLDYISFSGGFSDELRAADYGRPIGSGFNLRTVMIDSRQVPEVSPDVTTWDRDFARYASIQKLRSNTRLIRDVYIGYTEEINPDIVTELYFNEAFSVIMLADLFCSGVPLSTIDFEGDFTYRPGSSTEDLYTFAIRLLDSALTINNVQSSWSASVRTLKARASIALGDFAGALASLEGVDEFSMDFRFWRGTTDITSRIATVMSADDWLGLHQGYVSSVVGNDGEGKDQRSRFRFVADSKGGKGFPYLSDKDPRVRIDSSAILSRKVNLYGYPNYFPAFSLMNNIKPATYVEALLIKAEALLNLGSPDWLDVLNSLRNDGTWTLNSLGDTVWNAGLGSVSGLPPLTGPGAVSVPASTADKDAAIDLLFKERAYWLFYTGRRQGDMRRLVRNYGRPLDTVYPSGRYEGGSGQFWPYMNLPIPESERINPYFTGCYGRDK